MTTVPFTAEHSGTQLWACPNCSRVVAKLSEVEWQLAFKVFGPVFLCDACIALLEQAGADPMAGMVTSSGRIKTSRADGARR